MKIFFYLLIVVSFISACGGSEKRNVPNIKNTYYLDIKADNDSLQSSLIKFLDGKVTFYKDHKMEIMSANFLTSEDYPDMHYYKYINQMDKDVKTGTLKIMINVTGNMSTDSTFYTIPTYKYDGEKWQKISDLGRIQAVMEGGMAKRDKFYYKEIVKWVRDNTFSSTYN